MAKRNAYEEAVQMAARLKQGVGNIGSRLGSGVRQVAQNFNQPIRAQGIGQALPNFQPIRALPALLPVPQIWL